MNPTQDQNCPLCQKAAKFQFADYENQKHFYCDHCIEFRVSTSAEKRLAESIPEWRNQYSEMAKQRKDDTVLVITLPLGPKEQGVANPALVGHFVARNELPK